MKNIALLIASVWIPNRIRDRPYNIKPEFLIELTRNEVLTQYHIELHRLKPQVFSDFKRSLNKQGSNALASMRVFYHIRCICDMVAPTRKVGSEIKPTDDLSIQRTAYVYY